MRIYFSERDNFLLKRYLESKKELEIISLTKEEKELPNFVNSLLKYKVEVVIQIAPQWEWGRYVEKVAREIMDQGIKLISGEGAMFRWFGEDEFCGSEVGFYLSPWGFSGNSKIAYELPAPTDKDIELAKKLRNYIQPWNPQKNNGKILIIGQLDNDRSRYYSGPVNSNEKLIQKCSDLFGQEILEYRKHPKDEDTLAYGVVLENSGKKLKDIIYQYSVCVSINSTATIEAMCSGIPVINSGFAPWSGARSVIQPLNGDIRELGYEEYLIPLAALVHLHYLSQFNYGDPLYRALAFYSPYPPEAFKFNCLKFNDQPEAWSGKCVY